MGATAPARGPGTGDLSVMAMMATPRSHEISHLNQMQGICGDERISLRIPSRNKRREEKKERQHS